MDINYVLSCFDGVKRIKPDHYKAICPCHADDNASLSITVKNDKILMKCMAGCATSDILGVAGLSYSDLGSESAKKDFTLFDRMAFGQFDRYGDGVFVKDHYDYLAEDGTYLYTKVRFEGGDFGGDKKMIRYYQIDYVNGTWTHGKPEDCPKVLYRLPKLRKAIEDGFPINIVEGEKDVHTLEKFGWTAVTSGGANDWQKSFAHYFKGADVRIFPDNDKAGADLVARIVSDLRDYAYRIRVIKTSTMDKGDVTDYLNEGGHNKETLQALINEAPPIYAPWIELGKNSETVNADKLYKAFEKNEKYIITRNADGTGDRVYLYHDGVYEPCGSDMFKGEIYKYYGYGKATTNSVKNTYEMLMCRGNHFRSADDLNMDEDIINLANGILRVSTMKLEPHSPKYLTTCRVNVVYDPEAKTMPNFTKYITDFCRDDYGEVDTSKIMVIQEILGLIISNVHGYRPKKAYLLHSVIGNTGKTLLINLAMELVGRKRCVVIQLQSMNSKNRFALSSLPSARLVCCGDQTGADIEESSIFKSLTGGDSVTVEKKGMDKVDFHYKGCLLYGTNTLPDFKDDKGDQLFERLMIIPCQHVVPEAERDRSLLDKILLERSAIFNWAMIGLKRLIANNYTFTHCKAIDEVTENFRDKIDTVSRFLNANGYTVTLDFKDKVSASKLFDDYKAWCEDPANEISYYINTSQSFADRLAGHGVKRKKTRLNDRGGVFCYLGIKEGFLEADENDGVPFVRD